MVVSLFKRIRRRVGFVLIEPGTSRRRVRIFMGRPDGLYEGHGDRLWVYWLNSDGPSSGCCAAIGFSDNGDVTDTYLLFSVKETKVLPFFSAKP